MAKVYNTFTNGRMDSDTHHSLVDNKGYSYALNLRPSGYGEDGAMSSIRGSELLVDYSEEGTMTVVGMYSGDNNKLYSFLARRDGLSKIIETDIETKQSRVVIEDAEHLRFDLLRWENCEEVSHRYLLSVNQIDNYLYFSNEVWEQPRVVDITRDYGDFGLEDILVAKKPPRYAPTWKIVEANDIKEGEASNKFIIFAYRYKYIDGSYSPFSFYSDVAFLPKEHRDISHDNENIGMINILRTVNVWINTGGIYVTDIELIAVELMSNTAYVIANINKRKDVINGNKITDNEDVYVGYSFLTNYPIINDDIVHLSYSNIPKYPRSQAIVGERLFYANYKEGFNMIDKNHEYVNISFEKKLTSKPDVFSLKDRRTLISDFDYKVGVVYYNDYNESSTVLLDNDIANSTFSIRKEDRSNINTLQVKLKHLPPSWATKFKFVALYPKLEYDNILTNEILRENGYVKVLIDKSNKDKVKKGDYLIRYSDETLSLDKYYVIDIENKNNKLYAVIQDDLSIRSIDNITSNTRVEENKIRSPQSHYVPRVTSQEHCIIDFEFDVFNPNRYISDSGYSETKQLNYDGRNFSIKYNSDNNKGKIPKNIAGIIKKGQALEINLSLSYTLCTSYNPGTRYTSAYLVFSNLTHMGNLKFKNIIYADRDYPNLYDFVASRLKNKYLKVSHDNDNVYLGTTNEILDKLKNILINYDVKLKDRGIEKEFIIVETITTSTLYSDSLNEVFRTENKDTQNPYFYESPLTYDIEDGEHKGAGADGYWDTGLYNGYCWGNGIESYKIKDNLNGKRLEWSFRPNAVDPRGYGQVHRNNDITYSGVYNKDYRVNNLNMFIPSTANWRELPSEYGQIQRIVSSDGDIAVFCDDKVITVFYGKTLISDLQGNPNLATTQDVLGGHVVLPYNFGCQHPESISQSVDGIYFTDKKRKRYVFMSNKQMFELNPEGSGHHRSGVEEIKGASLFPSYYDEGYGEWVAGLGNHGAVVFNPQAKGFSHYYDYSFEYIHGMNGRKFTAYKGKIYEDEVLEDECNIFAGGQERSAKLTYVVNSEFGADKVFKAMSLQSSIPWDTMVRTNLMGSRFLSTAYTKKESFYHTHIYRDVETFQNSRGIGVIQSVLTPDIFEFSRPIDIDVSCGDILRNEQGTGIAVIENIQGNTITVNNGADFHAGDYVFARKQNHGGYSPDGAPIRGKWLQVDLSCKWHENFYITSTSTEIIESKF